VIISGIASHHAVPIPRCDLFQQHALTFHHNFSFVSDFPEPLR
jgi:hypothetical protein